AGDNFFNTDSSAMGSSAVMNQGTPPAPITGATALSGTSGSDSLSPGFTAGSTITVDGTTLTFVSGSPTSPNEISTSDTVQSLLSKIDGITGTTTPSTVHGGVVTINTPNAATFSITPAGALSALGFSSTSTVTAPQPPLRVFGSPLSQA